LIAKNTYFDFYEKHKPLQDFDVEIPTRFELYSYKSHLFQIQVQGGVEMKVLNF